MDSHVKSLFFFDSPQSRYQVLPYFRQQWLQAFQKKGIDCHFLNAPTKDTFHLLQKIKEAQPDFTVALNGLMPSSTGFFLGDYLKIPHLAILVDFPTSYYQLTQSAYTVIACPDEKACEFLRQGEFNRTFFLPHAVDSALFSLPESCLKHEMVFFSSFIDPEKILKEWDKTYPPSLVKILKNSAEKTLRHEQVSFWEAFVENLSSLYTAEPSFDLNQWDIFRLLCQLEDYLRARDKTEMLESLKPFPIDIYGDEGWSQWCKTRPHLRPHPAVNFPDALQIMRQSKIILNSCPSFKRGSHERVFYSYACHALPLTASNPFLDQYYADGESILYYRNENLNVTLDGLNEILKDDSRRLAIVQQGRQTTLQNHTWEHRVDTVLEYMSSLAI